LFIANDGGIWTSPDSGNNTVNRNANLVTRQFYGLTNDPANRNRIYGGQQDNGTSFRPDAGGTAWSFFTDSDGFQSLLNESDPWIVYSTIQGASVNRSKKGGSTTPLAVDYSPRYDSNESRPFFSLLIADPTNPAILYTGSYRLWKSTTGGEAWAPLPTATTDASIWSTTSRIRAIAVSKSNPQIIMVAKSTNVFRSTDGGSTWTRVITGLPGKVVNSLEIHPTDPNTVYAALAGVSGTSVYYTLNGGTSWSVRGTGLPSYSAQVVRFDPTDTTTLYCGTDIGVYRSIDSGATWSMFGTGLPAVSIYDVRAVNDGAILRAATHGRGVWELNVTGNTNNAPTASITTPVTSPQTVTKGSMVTFSGTFTDVDASDPLTAVWYFPDTWTSTPATSGISTSHTFNRAGRWPVTLTVTDSHGAKGSANFDIIVTEAGESCSAPIVIPGSGPFPYTVTVTTEESTTEASDPNPVGSCYPYSPQNGIWLSFTPAVSGTYTISACGSHASAVIAGFTGNGCGPYTTNGLCLVDYSPIADCASDYTASFSATAGTTVRLYVTNYFYQDFGPVSLTITNTSLTSTTPTISSIRPSLGSASGGTPVVVTGSGFAGGSTVSIGGAAATGVTVVSSSLITATTGAHAAGTVDASVTSGSTGTLKDAFTYGASSVTAPAGLLATAASSSQVNVSWTAVSGADHYEVYRRAAGGSFVLAGTPVANSYADTGRSADTAYLYKAKAIGSLGEISADSNIDLATTTIFTDDPLVVGSTIVKAVHMTEMRTAVNAVRSLAGLSLTSFTDPSLGGVFVKAIHITELRTSLDAARVALGLSALAYANTPTVGTSLIRAVDFTEIRNGTK
jgi:hypothetical protein